MTALPMVEAAVRLGVSPSTLRRWIAAGAPTARRGRRGRGCRTLVDLAAVQAWRRRGADAAVLLALGAGLPELLGRAVAEAHRLAPDKRNSAWVAAAAWQLAVSAIHDYLSNAGIKVADPVVPDVVERLRKIAGR